MIFYACLRYKDGYIEKVKCTSREEARQYINTHFDPEIYSQCWTE